MSADWTILARYVIIACVAILLGVIGYSIGFDHGVGSMIPPNSTTAKWDFSHNTVTLKLTNEQMGYFKDNYKEYGIRWKFSFWRVETDSYIQYYQSYNCTNNSVVCTQEWKKKQ